MLWPRSAANRSSIQIDPAAGASSPATSRKSVLFPEPLGRGVHKIRHTVDLFEHAADRLLVLSRIAPFGNRRLPDATDHGERRAQLVGCVGGEPPQLIE